MCSLSTLLRDYVILWSVYVVWRQSSRPCRRQLWHHTSSHEESLKSISYTSLASLASTWKDLQDKNRKCKLIALHDTHFSVHSFKASLETGSASLTSKIRCVFPSPSSLSSQLQRKSQFIKKRHSQISVPHCSCNDDTIICYLLVAWEDQLDICVLSFLHENLLEEPTGTRSFPVVPDQQCFNAAESNSFHAKRVSLKTKHKSV